MNQHEQILWQKIAAFPLDDTGATFSFSDRLARENGWTPDYTRRVVAEYRKFLFLCCVSPAGITPSDPVDQAWHLHLTYTTSYWTDLCRHTLNKELHHHPTIGGKKEARKFSAYYNALQHIYRQKFDELPPPDIWHDQQTRFSDIDFQRVNRRLYWLVPKPSRRQRQQLLVGVIIMFALASVQAVWDLANVLFLGFLLVAVIVAIRYRRRDGATDRKNNGSGCSGFSSGDGCSSDQHGDSGCSSGCSGCSGSGCSGCGSGD